MADRVALPHSPTSSQADEAAAAPTHSPSSGGDSSIHQLREVYDSVYRNVDRCCRKVLFAAPPSPDALAGLSAMISACGEDATRLQEALEAAQPHVEDSLPPALKTSKPSGKLSDGAISGSMQPQAAVALKLLQRSVNSLHRDLMVLHPALSTLSRALQQGKHDAAGGNISVLMNNVPEVRLARVLFLLRDNTIAGLPDEFGVGALFLWSPWASEGAEANSTRHYVRRAIRSAKNAYQAEAALSRFLDALRANSSDATNAAALSSVEAQLQELNAQHGAKNELGLCLMHSAVGEVWDSLSRGQKAVQLFTTLCMHGGSAAARRQSEMSQMSFGSSFMMLPAALFHLADAVIAGNSAEEPKTEPQTKVRASLEELESPMELLQRAFVLASQFLPDCGDPSGATAVRRIEAQLALCARAESPTLPINGDDRGYDDHDAATTTTGGRDSPPAPPHQGNRSLDSSALLRTSPQQAMKPPHRLQFAQTGPASPDRVDSAPGNKRPSAGQLSVPALQLPHHSVVQRSELVDGRQPLPMNVHRSGLQQQQQPTSATGSSKFTSPRVLPSAEGLIQSLNIAREKNIARQLAATPNISVPSTIHSPKSQYSSNARQRLWNTVGAGGGAGFSRAPGVSSSSTRPSSRPAVPSASAQSTASSSLRMIHRLRRPEDAFHLRGAVQDANLVDTKTAKEEAKQKEEEARNVRNELIRRHDRSFLPEDLEAKEKKEREKEERRLKRERHAQAKAEREVRLAAKKEEARLRKIAKAEKAAERKQRVTSADGNRSSSGRGASSPDRQRVNTGDSSPRGGTGSSRHHPRDDEDGSRPATAAPKGSRPSSKSKRLGKGRQRRAEGDDGSPSSPRSAKSPLDGNQADDATDASREKRRSTERTGSGHAKEELDADGNVVKSKEGGKKKRKQRRSAKDQNGDGADAHHRGNDHEDDDDDDDDGTWSTPQTSRPASGAQRVGSGHRPRSRPHSKRRLDPLHGGHSADDDGSEHDEDYVSDVTSLSESLPPSTTSSDAEDLPEETVSERKERFDRELMFHYSSLYARRVNAVCVLQRAWRCSRARLELHNRQQSLYKFIYLRQKAAALCVVGFLRSIVSQTRRRNICAQRAIDDKARVERERVMLAAAQCITRNMKTWYARRQERERLCQLLNIKRDERLRRYEAAAIIVQRWWRIAPAKREYWRQRAIEVAEETRRRAEAERLERAATTIQRRVRGMIGRMDFYRHKVHRLQEIADRQRRLAQCTDLITTVLREYELRRQRLIRQAEVAALQADEAAQVIQVGWRAALERRRLAQALECARLLRSSASCIQRAWRRYFAGRELRYLRRLHDTVSQDRIDAEFRLYRSTLCVQGFARIVLAKVEMRRRKAAAGRAAFQAIMCMQAVGRGMLAREAFAEYRQDVYDQRQREAEEREARTLYTTELIRGFLLWKNSTELREQRRAAKYLDTEILRRLVKAELHREACALRIQRQVRLWLQRRRAREAAEEEAAARAFATLCIVKIQCWWRQRMAVMERKHRLALRAYLTDKRLQWEEVEALLRAEKLDALHLHHYHERTLCTRQKVRTALGLEEGEDAFIRTQPQPVVCTYDIEDDDDEDCDC